MKSKILAALLFGFALLTLGSCKKEWNCTCTATMVGPPGTTIHEPSVINTNVIKSVAEADCQQNCSIYYNNPSYTNVSATVTPL
jgi:hypothetical protein